MTGPTDTDAPAAGLVIETCGDEPGISPGGTLEFSGFGVTFLRRQLGRRTACARIHCDKAQVDRPRIVERDYVGPTQIERKQTAVTDEKKAKIGSDRQVREGKRETAWWTRDPTGRVVLSHDVVIVVHRHDASPSDRPSDSNCARGCRVVRTLTASRTGAEQKHQPCKGKGTDDAAVCRECHRPVR